MDFGLTFGSVGDIIAICQVAVQLRRALNGGSAQEFQQLRNDLDAFTRILMLVVGTFEQHETSPWLIGLNQTAKSAVDECAIAIQEMLGRIQPKYGDSLGHEASTRKGLFKGACRKFEWAIKEKQRARDLRELLGANTQRLSLLVALATKKSARVDNETLLARIAIVDEQMRKAEVHDDEALRLLRAQSAAQYRQEQRLKSIDNKLETLSLVHDRQEQRLAQVSDKLDVKFESAGVIKRTLTAACEVKDMISQLTQHIVTLQVSLSNSFYMRSLDPTKDLPAVLEDSLGRVLPIPVEMMELLEWATLHRLLERKFEGAKGYSMVHSHRYALEDSASGHDLDRRSPLAGMLRRGMRITMTMLFYDQHQEIIRSGACPRCRRVTGETKDTTIQCETTGCRMVFQLQQAVNETPDLKESVVSMDSRKEKDVPIESVSITPADFQRVRIVYVKRVSSTFTWNLPTSSQFEKWLAGSPQISSRPARKSVHRSDTRPPRRTRIPYRRKQPTPTLCPLDEDYESLDAEYSQGEQTSGPFETFEELYNHVVSTAPEPPPASRSRKRRSVRERSRKGTGAEEYLRPSTHTWEWYAKSVDEAEAQAMRNTMLYQADGTPNPLLAPFTATGVEGKDSDSESFWKWSPVLQRYTHEDERTNTFMFCPKPDSFPESQARETHQST